MEKSVIGVLGSLDRLDSDRIARPDRGRWIMASPQVAGLMRTAEAVGGPPDAPVRRNPREVGSTSPTAAQPPATIGEQKAKGNGAIRLASDPS